MAVVTTASSCETAEMPRVLASGSITRVTSGTASFLVHSLESPTPYETSGRRVVYEFDLRRSGKTTAPVVVLQGRDKKFWVGREQDGYIDARDRLIGVGLRAPGVVEWCSNVLTDSIASTVDEILNAFEAQASVSGLASRCAGGDSDLDRAASRTDMRQVFSSWAFNDGPGSAHWARDMKNVVVGVSDGQLHLHLENPASSFVGEVWIDVATKRVTRAVEGKKQLSRDIASDDPMAISWGPQREFFTKGDFEIVSWENAQKVLLREKLKGGKEYDTGWLTIYPVNGKQYLTRPPTPTAFREFAKSRIIDISGFAPE